MDYEGAQRYQNSLRESLEETPAKYFHWLREAIAIANANLGDLNEEKRLEAAVQMAGHMARMHSAARIEETLGIIHSACERIAERD